MAFGYEAHPPGRSRPGAPTPFHHPPRPAIPERSRTAPVPVEPHSVPVSIPSTSSYQSPPPPLPPPRHVDTSKVDLGWHMANREGRGLPGNNSTPIRAGSSLLGGRHPPPQAKVPERKVDIVALREAPPRRSPPTSQPRQHPTPPAPKSLLNTLKEREEVVPASPPYLDLRGLMEYNKLHSEKPMSSDAVRRSSQSYDKQMLAKIGGGQPGQQAAPGSPNQPMLDPSNTLNRLNGQFILPGAHVGAPPPGPRSPLSDSGLDHYPLPSFPRRFSFRQQDPSTFADKSTRDRTNTPGMAELSLQDSRRHPGPPPPPDYQQQRAGQKRRANSPPPAPPNMMHSPMSQQQAWERGMMQLTGGRPQQMQSPQYNAPPVASTMSSVASSTIPNSYLSSFTQPSTAATSYNSVQFAPAHFQSGPLANQSQQLPKPYPPPPEPVNTPPHTMHPMGAPPIPRSKGGSGLMRSSGMWICECCPKKPRKFDNEQDLRLHEMEKQYICQFCHNRFKNKNEAERHQNSLHLRKHSWSCSALTSYEDAFYSTPTNTLAASLPPPGQTARSEQQGYQGLHSTATDTCGYCGLEFTNPPNWEDRVHHLNQAHKFGECNQTKKFFRADHFRQHLKHSHAGTSGKWTNELEKACMKDEPPPQPLPGMPAVHNAVPGGQPGIIMVGQQALLAQHQLNEQKRIADEQAAAEAAQAQQQAAQAVASVDQQQQQQQQQQQIPSPSPSYNPAAAASSAPPQQQQQPQPPSSSPNLGLQFPGFEALKQFQPPPQGTSTTTRGYSPTTTYKPDPNPLAPPPPQALQLQQQQPQLKQMQSGSSGPEEQAQSLAQHLQQAQRELTAKQQGQSGVGQQEEKGEKDGDSVMTS